MSIAQILGASNVTAAGTVPDYHCAELQGLFPHKDRAKDTAQRVKPHDYDLHGVLINSVTLKMPHNTLSQSVGIKTSTLPPVYRQLKRSQTEDLAAELGLEMGDPDIVAHIPVSDKPDERPIPILQEVVNGFHATEVARTFGGVTSQHMWKGLIQLPPQLAVQLGFREPPAAHVFPAPADPTIERAYNSWALVPMGHVLSHIANLPASNVRKLGYEVYQLKLPHTGEVLPWLVMDLWTIYAYMQETIANVVLPIDSNRVSIADQWVELVPLTDASWIKSCVAGCTNKEGSVSFRLVVSYTMFPKDFRKDPSLIPVLSEGFPKLETEFRAMIDSDEIAAKQAIAKRAAAGGGNASKTTTAVVDPLDNSLAAELADAALIEPMDDGDDDE